MRKTKKTVIGLTALIIMMGLIIAACAGGAKSSDTGFKSSYDVVIIGAGGAGFSAAIAAKEAGADVVIFEKMGIPGGNSIRSTGGINACGTEYQKAKGVEDSVELFYSDVMKGGGNISDQALVRNLAERSASSVAWLVGMGADLTDVGRMAGSSVDRTHRPTGGAKIGPELVSTLERHAEKMGIPVILMAEVTNINVQNGKATGVEVTFKNAKHTVNAKAVVLAAGGFGANNEMAASYVPSLKGFATTNHPGATGDGIRLAEKIGAAFVDMEQIQTHPTHAPEKEMITEAVRGNGAIMVNRSGQRFVDEMLTRDVVSAAILAQEGGSAFLVFEDSIRKSLLAIEDYVKLGIVIEAPTPEALGALIGGGNTLAGTISTYNQAVASKNDSAFGRTSMARSLSTPPFYAIDVLPAVHHTMGGVKIDTEARVLSKNGNPIQSLYAAGEVAGGIHGTNRLGGMALADIITYGRIAGTNAAAGK